MDWERTTGAQMREWQEEMHCVAESSIWQSMVATARWAAHTAASWEDTEIYFCGFLPGTSTTLCEKGSM